MNLVYLILPTVCFRHTSVLRISSVHVYLLCISSVRKLEKMLISVLDSLKRNGVSETAKEPVESSSDSLLTVDVMIHNDEVGSMSASLNHEK